MTKKEMDFEISVPLEYVEWKLETELVELMDAELYPLYDYQEVKGWSFEFSHLDRDTLVYTCNVIIDTEEK